MKRRRRIMLTVAIPVLPLAIAMLYSRDHPHANILGISVSTIAILSVPGVLIALGVMLYVWRCPQCDRYLGRSLNPKFCPHCGTPLQNDPK